MVRKLKYAEQKLLKKVDFLTYKQDDDHRATSVIRYANPHLASGQTIADRAGGT